MAVKNYIMAVDPGLSGTGWAIWDECRPGPRITGIIPAPQGGLEKRAELIAYDLRKIIKTYWADTVYCEYPAFFTGSTKSYASTASGDLGKLFYLIGVIGGITASVCDFQLVHVRDWKGQLSKEAVEHRILKIIGRKGCKKFKSHVWDAVGIGLYKLGHL